MGDGSASVKCGVSCNIFVGTNDKKNNQADERLCEIASNLPDAVSIEANPEDRFTCWYREVGVKSAGWIAPVDLRYPPKHQSSHINSKGKFQYISIPQGVEVSGLYKGAEYANRVVDSAMFYVVANGMEKEKIYEHDVVDRLMDTFSLSKNDYPLLRYQLFQGNNSFSRGLYVVNLDGKLPKGMSGEWKIRNRSIPPLEQQYCPEYATHRRESHGEVALNKKWELYKDEANGDYTAIPRIDLRSETDAFSNRIGLYTIDLEQAIMGSEWLKGDDRLFRYLSGIEYTAESGAVGLFCPEFRVHINEYKKKDVSCLEWEERLPKEKISGKYEVHKDGFIIPVKNNRSKVTYITDKKQADVNTALVKWMKRDGLEMSSYQVESREVSQQNQCSTYELRRSAISSIKEGEKKPAQVPMASLPLGAMPKETPTTTVKVDDKLSGSSSKKSMEKVNETIVHISPRGEKRYSLVDEIVKVIDPERPNTICLAIDQSESMRDDIREVRMKVSQAISSRLKESDGDVDICVVRFLDENVKAIMPLDVNRGLEQDMVELHKALQQIGENLIGTREYLVRAADVSIDQMKHGRVDSKKTILLLTDEEGDPWVGDGEPVKQGLARVKRQAAAAGIDFKVIMRSDEVWDRSMMEASQKSAEEQRKAAHHLFEKGYDAVVAKNIKFLTDINVQTEFVNKLADHRDETVREIMARRLSDIHDDKVQSFWVEKWTSDDDILVRKAVAGSISEVRNYKTQITAAMKLAGNRSHLVQEALANNLPGVRNNAFQAALAKLLVTGYNYSVHIKVASMLPSIRDDMTQMSLAKELAGRDEVGIRETVAMSLPGIRNHAFQTALARLLAMDKDENVRKIVAERLFGVRSELVRMSLANQLAADKDYHVRDAAKKFLAGE